MKTRLQLFVIFWGVLVLMQGCDSDRDHSIEHNRYVVPLTGESVEDELSSAMLTRKKLQEGKELL